MANNNLFTATDQSFFKTYSARALSQISVWNGNRVIDLDHIHRIKDAMHSIKHLNINPFRIALIKNEEGPRSRFIIDGQHRHHILKEYFANTESEDFQVLVAGKLFDNEDEVMKYFKILNNTKAISWKEDPVMIANKFIEALMTEFNKNPKRHMIRSGARVNRPFLSVDKLRETLLARRVFDWTETPLDLVERAKQKNMEVIGSLHVKDVFQLRDMETRALDYGFGLAMDEKLPWI